MDNLRMVMLLAGGVLSGGSAARAPEQLPAGNNGTHAASQLPAAIDPPPPSVQPGFYATQGGWGQLRIAPAAGTTGSRFRLETGNSGYGCSMSGTVQNAGGTALVDREGRAAACALTLRSAQGNITLDTASNAACNAYCGNNGSFKGTYHRILEACAPHNVDRTRQHSRALLARGAHLEAVQVLEPVFLHCLDTLAFVDAGGVRLDVAVARHLSGDDAGCLAALQPYAADTQRSDDELTDGMSPAVADDFIAIIAAARDSLARCRAE